VLAASAVPVLSVIVLPGGRPEDRQAVAAAFARQTLREVAVVGGSPPGSSGVGPRSFSPGSALNLAATCARSPLLAFVDAALVPRPDWAEQIARWFALRPDCAAVRGATRRRGGQLASGAGPLHLAVRRGTFMQSRGFDDLTPGAGGRQAEISRALADLGTAPDTSDEIVASLWGVPARPPLVRSNRLRPSPLVGDASARIVATEASATRPVASVVMPAWGLPAWAETCLVSLLRQDFPEPYEVIVPTDAGGLMERLIRARYPAVRTCTCRPSDGPGGARNRGLDAARGEYVAFLDGDCLPERDWLRRIVGRCRSRAGAPVSGWLRTAYPHSWVAEADNTTEQGAMQPSHAVPEAGLSGCNMCIGRALVNKAGARFAEGVFGAEDVALLGRLPARALPALLDPAAQVFHLRRDTFAGALRHQFAIGVGSGQLRGDRPMRGALLARHSWAAPLIAPGRLALMFARALQAGPRRVLGLARLSPLILPELLAYTVGFMAGAGRASGRRGSGA
jgi:hypothetical protein